MDAAPILAALISASVLLLINLIGQGIQIWMHMRTYRITKAQVEDKKIEEQRKETYKKLNEFYGPFQQYLNESQELYRIFAATKPKGFRTLTYLLNRQQVFEDGKTVQLTPADDTILKTIFKIGEKLLDLITSKAGLIDDPVLRNNYQPLMQVSALTDVKGLEKNGLLAIFATHLMIINLAYKGELSGDPEPYKNYVFPRDLPGIIDKNIDRLAAELTQLNSLQDTSKNI